MSRFAVMDPETGEWTEVTEEGVRLGLSLAPDPAPLDAIRPTDGGGYELHVWQKHEPSGVVVLKGHPQLGGRYCLTDGGDWPCAAVRHAKDSQS